uniref:U-box domain-containing protein 12 n=1 Tax=Anthurium amnicola TaxID=1678845 RepID=A0A1D1XMD6_9ARAE
MWMGMAKCSRDTVGSLVLDNATGGGRLRLRPLFSPTAIRRWVVEALVCGVSQHRREGGGGRVGGLGSRAPTGDGGKKPVLSELLRAEMSDSGSEEEEETSRKVEVFEELEAVVRRLQSDRGDLRREAAMEVRRLAKVDPSARETLAMLGAIPPLVGMLDSGGDVGLQVESLYALLNLGIGNAMNKSAIAAAGVIPKMVKLVGAGSNAPVSEAVAANFLGLSALDANKPAIGASGAIPFLAETFRDPSRAAQARQDALRALLNLSLAPANAPRLVDAGLVPDLLASVGDMEVTERALSVLSNVVATAEGRRAVSRAREAFQILVDVLNWADSPGCQEKATYVLMVMAHKAYSDRAAMVEAGIVSSLLELTLLGTALAQKRASRILECLRVDKGKQVAKGGGSGGAGAPAVSAPLYWVGPEGRGAELDDDEDDAGMSEERKAVKRLVQQSLQHNMRRIARRANLPQDFAPSDHFMALAGTSTSKSLPF